MAKDSIIIKGARQHNLKNIDLEIPRDQLVVFTGLSGSGKSSLAFDTIYAEGQRRYVESLSSYARQFLGQMDKPDVDLIEGLSPSISIDQKTTSRNPRSTVGTVTEIYDYLRLLYARIGIAHCHQCGKEISQQTVEQMVDRIMELPENTRVQVMAPIARGRKGEYKRQLDDIKRDGYVRVRIDGEMRELSEEIQLDKNKKHNIEVVVDRLVIRPDIQGRLADSLETALKLSEGVVLIDVLGQQEMLFSEKFACVDCGISIEDPAPRLFSFNSPFGACPTCDGLGYKMEFDPDIILDPDKPLLEGGIVPWRGSNSQWLKKMLLSVCKKYGINPQAKVGNLTDQQKWAILYGVREPVTFEYQNTLGRIRTYEARYAGVIPYLNRRLKETSSDQVSEELQVFMSVQKCPDCQGARLRRESLSFTVGGLSIHQLTTMPVKQCRGFFDELKLSERHKYIARQILKEIQQRLGFLCNVGLDYLTLERSSGSLSGGEAQRIRLATQIGSSLVGVLYILDEPSIGLHQRDNNRLLEALKGLRDLGNTLIVVEHDTDTILQADYVVDIGPGAGEHGGRIVAMGTPSEIMANEASITGQFLSGKRQITIPKVRRSRNGKSLIIKEAREHNLKGIDVEIPLGMFVCVTGVSGSGKSTLVNDILYKQLAHILHGAVAEGGAHGGIQGLENLDKVINIDQSPIGRTPRSNPATYTGAFDRIRQIFAETVDAKIRGYKAGRFSFNVKGGRCEACNGDGIIKIEMHFLPDVYVPCEICRGKRYNRETLEVKYKGKSIAEVLDMTVEEGCRFFQAVPSVSRKLETLYDVGLGYMKLGQPATTLSGGEAQRVKLATELARKSNGKTIYILDEPTTGLHAADVEKLLRVLHRLVDAGDTVLVIEHNLDVVKTADYIIDLGPEGGDEGGRVIGVGTPEEIADHQSSYTGQYLKPILQQSLQKADMAK
jgi:excinuclease ABC subunit A